MNQVASARVEVGCDDVGLGHGLKVVYLTSRVHEVGKWRVRHHGVAKKDKEWSLEVGKRFPGRYKGRA